jgi:hypothetical protein
MKEHERNRIEAELSRLSETAQKALHEAAVDALCAQMAATLSGPRDERERAAAQEHRRRWLSHHWSGNKLVMARMYELLTQEPLYNQLQLPAPPIEGEIVEE